MKKVRVVKSKDVISAIRERESERELMIHLKGA